MSPGNRGEAFDSWDIGELEMTEAVFLEPAKGNPLVAHWVTQTLRRWPGVSDARCSAATGRVRVDWNGAGDSATRPDLDELLDHVLKMFTLSEAYATAKGRVDITGKNSDARSRGRWHAKAGRWLSHKLRVSPQTGLSREQAERRLVEAGSNRIPSIAARGRLDIFASQFNNAASALLASSLGASLLTGGLVEAATILAVMGINGWIGYLTESQAEAALQALSGLDSRETVVWRSGRAQIISMDNVVPGDVIMLISGRSVPADARLIETKNLLVDESMLTGESVPIAKTASKVLPLATPLIERENMVYKGTVVVSGEGRALVVSTGLATEAGRIQIALENHQRPSTHLQDQMNQMNRHLAELSAASSGALFLLGWLRRQSFYDLFRTSVSMAVAAVPEGLPTVTTWALSRAVNRLAEQKVLIRNLQAIETLGSLKVLCLDKTGTLTENKMKVVSLAIPWREKALTIEETLAEKPKALRELMDCAALCNDDGSPTERALREAAEGYGLNVSRLRKLYRRESVQHRDQKRSYMITWHCRDGRPLQMLKGSPEEVLRLCRRVQTAQGARAITKPMRARLARQNNEMSDQSLRVLAFARSENESEWTWLGLMGLHDAPRPNMKAVLAEFHKAGIRTVMITGDQEPTARAIARELGISNGEELVSVDMRESGRSDEELVEIAARAHVFARVVPEEKQRIVRALRAGGCLVGMVGDGINDALALKAADVGIAIGESGSSVAREVAGVTLLDDQISRLMEAITIGRATSEALRKAVRFLVTTNLAELGVVLGETAASVPEIMDPLQLLWLNMVTDTFPALAMAMDRPRAGILQGGPPATRLSLLSEKEAREVVREASALVLPVVLGLLYGHARGLTKAQNQTIALNIIIISQMIEALESADSGQRINWRELFERHRPLATASLGSLGAHFGLTSIPGVRRLFKLETLRPLDFTITSLIPVAVQTWGRP